jgi:hypothetical protein
MVTYERTEDQKPKFISDTGVECNVCRRGSMMVKIETHSRSSGDITQQLECSNCGESYPRLVSADKVTVIHDPNTSAIKGGNNG